MNCPYCGAQMKDGYIVLPRSLARWYPEEIGPPFSKGVVLSDKNIFEMQRVSAFCCEACKKVIIDLP